MLHILGNVPRTKAHFYAKCHLDPSSRNRHGRIVEGNSPLFGEELGPHLTQCRLGRGLPLYRMAMAS